MSSYEQCVTASTALLKSSVLQCVQCVAVCCSVLQCVAVCCNVLQCVAACSVVQCIPVYLRATVAIVVSSAAMSHGQHSTVEENRGNLEMQRRACYFPLAAVCCSVLQCVAACCSVLQCVAVCCSVRGLRRSRDRATCLLLSPDCSVLQCVAVCCSVLLCVLSRCSDVLVTFS